MRPYILLTTLVCSAVMCFAQSNDTTSRIDKLFSFWNNATPGGSVLVSRGDQIIYHKAYGLADLERNVPNTTETIFEAGSVSKQFTAFSILLLESEGKLSVTDDVRKYVPELPDYGSVITIQHLLNHTSGLKDWGSVAGVTGWPRGSRIHTSELALHIIMRQKSLNFKPGNEYSYSNTNYTLLFTIVERVSKQPLEDFTNERIFKPLGMTHTRWRSNFRDIVPDRAQAYYKTPKGYGLVMPFENVYGHGGLLTTTGDLLKWNRNLETHQVGGAEVYTRRTTPGKFNNGLTGSYAAGLEIGSTNGFKSIVHSGSTAGYKAYLIYYPGKKLTIALLSNEGDIAPVALGQQVAHIFLGTPPDARKTEPKAITVPEADAKKWAGTYKSIRNFDVISFEQQGQQVMSNGHALKFSHPDSLFLDNQKWAYKKNGNIVVISGNDTSSYKKVNPAVDVKTFASYPGNYYSDESESGFTVVMKDNKLQLVNSAIETLPLEPLFRDGFLMDGYALVEFKRNTKGVVTGFDVSVGRAEKIPFNKVK